MSYTLLDRGLEYRHAGVLFLVTEERVWCRADENEHKSDDFYVGLQRSRVLMQALWHYNNFCRACHSFGVVRPERWLEEMKGQSCAIGIAQRLYDDYLEMKKADWPFIPDATWESVLFDFLHPGYVYLIKAHGGLYKIGRTIYPDRRLHTFEIKLPFQVELEHLIPCKDHIRAERELHQRYANQRVRGEWFDLSMEDVSAIKSIKEM